jgi:alpha-beta hydrolase superfamily lysophospholipase
VSVTAEPGSLRAADGTVLYTERRHVDGATGVVLIVHGFGEHLGRYAHVAEAITAAGLATVAYDMRGHGRSAGRRGHVRRFGDFLADLDLALGLARQDAGERPVLALAHSHGGLVLTRRLVDDPAVVDGAVLSAPFLGLALPAPRVKVLAARAASRLAPILAMPTQITPDMLSHDAAVQAAAAADPLSHQVATPRWFTESSAAQATVHARAAAITTPLLLQLPEGDRITDIEAAARVVAAAGSTDTTTIRYPGFEHESYNEIGRERPIADAVAWLVAHAGRSGRDG